MYLLLNSGEKLVVDNVKKSELLHAFFPSVFRDKVWLRKRESNKFGMH